MKKMIAVSLCVCMLSLSSCANKETTITRSENESVAESTTEENSVDVNSEEGQSQLAAIGDVEVDQGLLNVELTFPAEFVGEISQDELDQKVAEDDGFISATLNDDGSVTYVMTHDKYDEFMEATTESMDQSFQDTIDSGDYPNIVSITHNEDFTDFTVEYAADQVGLDGFIILQFYFAGGMYGIFTGETPENVHVAFVNSETGEIIQESNSRDMNDNAEES